MSDLPRWLRVVSSHLDEAGAKYALVGGLAVGARCQARFTKDIDFAVATASGEEAERLASTLIHSGFRTFQDFNNSRNDRIATLRLLPPGVYPDDVSGEALLPSLVDGFQRVFESRCRLTNLYGPTEAAIDVSYYDSSAENPGSPFPSSNAKKAPPPVEI